MRRLERTNIVLDIVSDPKYNMILINENKLTISRTRGFSSVKKKPRVGTGHK